MGFNLGFKGLTYFLHVCVSYLRNASSKKANLGRAENHGKSQSMASHSLQPLPIQFTLKVQGFVCLVELYYEFC